MYEQGRFQDPKALVPVYLRRSDAEINLDADQHAAKLGGTDSHR
jgi:hypothetical protein